MANKKYDVYGLGNALLDLEVKVTLDELKAYGIQKGVMTLVEEDEQQKMLEMFAGKSMVKACGGSAANTMIALSQFGAKGFLSCRVANDKSGSLFLNDLKAHGIDTNLEQHLLEAGTTGKCLVMIDEEKDRTMMTHLGATFDFSTAEIKEEAIISSDTIYIEGYLVASESAREAAIKACQIAKANQVKTSLTLSDLNMVKFFKEGLIEMMGEKLDILFCNEAEAKYFCNETDERKIRDALKPYAKTFIMTKGEKGALLYDGNILHTIAGKKVNVVDTLGAGDMFAGAYLYALSQQKSLIEAATFANQAAAKIVTHFGPRLPSQNDKIASTITT